MGIPSAVTRIITKYNRNTGGNVVLGTPFIRNTKQTPEPDQSTSSTISNTISNTILNTKVYKVHLFIDTNGSLYYCNNKYKPKSNVELIKQTCSYLDSLANLYNNSTESNSNTNSKTNPNTKTKIIYKLETYYIALDGVPPRSKIEQQRARRFHKIEENSKKDYNKKFATDDELKLMESVGESSTLDTNSFTPGSVFMKELNDGITKHFTESTKYKDVDVHFSGTDVPMEGEHKLFNYIKQQKTQNKYGENDLIIVYGLDADLIMLALASDVKHILLLREKTEFGNFDSFEHETHNFLYFDIDVLKLAIIAEFEDEVGDILPEEVNNYINDFVVLYFILGNDFVPKIPWLSISNNGHEKLLDCYYKIHNMRREFLTVDPHATVKNQDKLRLNNELLIHLFETLALNERQEMIDYHEKRQEQRIYYNKEMTTYEKRNHQLKFYPLKFLDMEARVNPSARDWFYRYYQVCFRWRKEETNSYNINKVVTSYLESIYWTYHYYFSGEVPSWSWYCPYHYGPLCKDIEKFINNYKDTRYKINNGYDINRIKFNKGTPVKSQELLFMVLPYYSRNIMSVNVRNKLEKLMEKVKGKNTDNFSICEQNITKYFPLSYKISLPYHKFYWECHPMIKPMDYKDVKDYFKDIKLSKEESDRNKVGKHKHWLKQDEISQEQSKP